MTEPIDQATKDLIEKEAQVAADCEYDVDYPYEKYYVKGYIAGATVWAEQLKQERALMKDLVGYVIAYKGLAFIQSLIQKAKDKSHE